MNRGYCGIGIEHPKLSVNVGALWRAAYCFNADFIFSIGDTARGRQLRGDTVRCARHIPQFIYRDGEDFLGHLPCGAVLVGIEIADNARPLTTFVHPERAVYLLGPENGSLSEGLIGRCSSVVVINTERCLNVAQAGAIVLYDRQAKSRGARPTPATGP